MVSKLLQVVHNQQIVMVIIWQQEVEYEMVV